MLTTTTPTTLTRAIRGHLPRPVADSILTDPKWQDNATKITTAYGHDAALLDGRVRALASRLERSPATATWITTGAYAPSSWLTRNLDA